MSMVLDLIVLAVLALGVILGVKRGFVRTAIELAGYVAVLVIAFAVATPVAKAVYDAAVRPGIEKSIVTAVSGAEVPDLGALDLGALVDQAYDRFPGPVSELLAGNGITAESIKESVGQTSYDAFSVEGIASGVADAVSPAVVSVIRIGVVLLVFVIGLFLVRLIAGACNGVVSRLPLVGSVNAWLGGVAGLLKGFALAFVLANVLMTVLTLKPDGLLGITVAGAKETMLFARLCWLLPA